jgi:DNA-binding response OmpR family regulator
MNCEMHIVETISRKILIVGETSPDLESLQSALLADGFQVRFTTTLDSALTEWRKWQSDIIVVYKTDPHVIAAFRKISTRVFVLARTYDCTNCIELLDAGADDCVGKSCSIAEFRARIRSKLRTLQPTHRTKDGEEQTM